MAKPMAIKVIVIFFQQMMGNRPWNTSARQMVGEDGIGPRRAARYRLKPVFRRAKLQQDV